MEPLTLKKKVLIHLLDFLSEGDRLKARDAGRVDVPFEMTQDGIAETFRIRQAHVSRALAELEADGLVSRGRGHVKGSSRSVAYYHLTWDGQTRANEILRKLNAAKIKYRDAAGNVSDIEIADFIRLRSGKIRIVHVLNCLGDDGVISDEKLEAESIPDKKMIDFADNVVEIKYFFGRKNELKQISEWMTSHEGRFIVMRGIAGIGKTTLMSKIALDYKDKIPIFWYRVHEWSSLRNMLEHLGGFLSRLGRKQLESYLKSREVIDIEELTAILDFSGIKAMLILDDFHKAKDELVLFLTAFKEMIEKYDGVKTIVTSRYNVPFYDRRDVIVKKTVLELELGGLDRESSIEVLKTKGLDPSQWERIYSLTRGHPLLLEIIKSAEDLDTWSDLKKYLQEEIVAGLTEKEKNMLYTASVFRYPFSPRAFFTDEEADYDTIDSLVRKSLLQAAGNTYDAHDVIKEFFYRRLTPAQKVHYHTIAAEYYRGEIGELACIEAQYHTLMTGDHKTAAELAVKEGQNIISKGYLEEFMNILEKLDITKVGETYAADILSFIGDIYGLWGEWKMSLSLYEKALAVCKTSGDRIKSAELNRKIGGVHEKSGDNSKAMEHYRIALEWAGEPSESLEHARIMGAMGSILMRLGKYEKALEYLNKDMEIAEKYGDLREKSIVYHNLGIIYFNTGDADRALECTQKCLAMNEELGDSWGIGTCYTNMANIYMKLNDLKNALEYNVKSIKVRQSAGDVWGISTCLNNIGNVYYRLRDTKKAVDYYEKSLSLFERLGDERGIIAASNNLGLLSFESGDLEKALSYYNRTLKMLLQMGDQKNIAATSGNLGMVYISMGEPGKALECYENSVRAFRAVNDRCGEAICHNNMGNVHFQTGNYDESVSCYRKAIEIFESMGDKQGISAGYHNLGLISLEKESYDDAAQLFEKAFKMRSELNDVHGMISSLNSLALALCKLGGTKKAVETIENALDLAASKSVSSVEAELWRTKGIILASMKKYKESDEYFNRSLKHFETEGNRIELARTYFEFGKILKKRKNRNAPRYLKNALNIFEREKRKNDAEKVKKIIG